jgi:hypothetical protein
MTLPELFSAGYALIQMDIRSDKQYLAFKDERFDVSKILFDEHKIFMNVGGHQLPVFPMSALPNGR